jgi:hypothetical protein
MGNICGKSDSEAFSQPGRTLGSAPPQPQRAFVPPHVGGPPRTVGGSPTPQGNNGDADDARRRAAEAAEVCYLAFMCLHLSPQPSLPNLVVCYFGISSPFPSLCSPQPGINITTLKDLPNDKPRRELKQHRRNLRASWAHSWPLRRNKPGMTLFRRSATTRGGSETPTRLHRRELIIS